MDEGANSLQEIPYEFSVLHEPDIFSGGYSPPSDEDMANLGGTQVLIRLNQRLRVEVYSFSKEGNDELELHHTVNQPPYSSSFGIYSLEFINENDKDCIIEYLKAVLVHTKIPMSERGAVAEDMYSAVVRLAAEGHEFIPILVDVVYVHRDCITGGDGDKNWDEWQYLEEEEEEEVEVEESRIIPAIESLIEALEKLKVMEMEICSICWEEMEVESKASRMPCKHIFHVSCIAEWLGRMHVCPLCRFEMPTS